MAKEAVKMSMDKGKAIESALSQIEKRFGKGSIMKMGERVRSIMSGRFPLIV